MELIPRATALNKIVRVPFDPQTMKLASTGDTVYSGATTSMSINDDGSLLTYDEGVVDVSGWLMPLGDLIANKFDEKSRLVRATSDVRGSISPDGAIAVIGRNHPQGGREFTVIDTRTRSETPIPGRHNSAVPADSTSIKITDLGDSTTTLYLYDYKRRQRSNTRVVNGARLLDVTRIGNAWAWIPSDGARLLMQGDGDKLARSIKVPAWFKTIFWLHGSPDGKKLAIIGYSQPNEDSLGVGVMTVPELKFTKAYSTMGEGGGTSWLTDGSLMMIINDTPESQTLWHWKEGQSPRRIGSIQRLVSNSVTTTVSGDMKNAFLVTRDDRRDIWMSRVVR
jgi:hypothetical protein